MAAPFSQKSCSYDLQSRPPPFVHSSVSEQSKLDNYNSKPIGFDMIELNIISKMLDFVYLIDTFIFTH